MADQATAKKKAEEEAAWKKAEEHASKKKAEDNRQEYLANQMIQQLYMLSEAEVQFLKAKPEIGRNGKVIYIPSLYYESVEVLLYVICRIFMALCGIEGVSYSHINRTRN